ncbi:MAG: elongation factor G [Dehalococcoidia bacterium]|nr:elongation factor G [Dehalococcoidia bacterium]
MPEYTTDQLRNVVLLSHGGAGKTSLTEAILFFTGVINRMGKVEEGTTTSDSDPDSIKRKISVSLSLLPCSWNNNKINLIDTPGYMDFVGEVKAGMRVVESAIFVVCAASGVEVGTELTWGYAEEAAMPRIIFVNKMDRENADFDRTLSAIQEKLGKGCVAIHLPIGSQKEFKGLVDLVSMKAFMRGKADESEIPGDLKTQADSLREKLIEAVADVDDNIMTKYLDGGEVTNDEIKAALKNGVVQGKIVPVLAGGALQSIGISSLLNAICDYMPSPVQASSRGTDQTTNEEVEITPDPAGSLVSLVFKTTADPYVGKLTYFRVFSGTISSNTQVWNSTKNSQERIAQLFLIKGKNQEPVSHIIAGDVGAVAKLAATSTGDTFSTKEKPFSLPPVKFPSPVFSAAIYPRTKADLDKLVIALPRLAEEDPTLNVHREIDTSETILSGMGETHIDVAAERMQRKFGVEVRLEIPKVPYKETITTSAKAEYKHKKQSGGHGQFGHVFLELEPMERGGGFEFTEKIVGGSIPRNYIPGVEKGVNEARMEGVLAGYPVVDTRAILFDGSFHPVDSSDIAFKIAGLHAFKKGFSLAHPIILEPVMNLKVTVPDSYTGDIIGDLNTKRAKVSGINPLGGTSVIEAQVPLTEIQRYATDLKSITQGRGIYTMEFSHLEEVPSFVAQKIIEARDAEKTAVKE